MSGPGIWNGCRKTVYILLFVLLIPISAYIFYGALDTLQYADAVGKVLQGRMVLLFLLGTGLFLCLFFTGMFQKLIPYLEERRNLTVPVFLTVMAVFQVTMVLTVKTSLRHDHLKIFDTAVMLLDRETIAQTHFKQYFMKYPNNIPLCLFTCFWLKLASVLRIPKDCWMEFIKVVNLMFMNIGLFCTFRLYCKYRSARNAFFLLFLLLLNPLWYLLGQMYYTSTISLAFSMGAVWLFDQAGEQAVLWKRCILYLFMGIVLAAGFKIRATVILTAISIFIYALLRLRNIHTSKEAVSFLSALAGVVLTLVVYGQAERAYAGFDPSETGYPAVHWIMMSAQGEGQYNSADDAYTGSFDTKEEQLDADLALLKERLKEMGAGGLLTLFRNKMRVAFSDGTDDYYSLFRTMSRTSWIQKYVNGGRSDYLAVYAHGFHGMLSGLVLLGFLLRVFCGQRSLLDIFAFNICGAYLFYLIWEVDHAYSIPFMLMLLIWASDGMCGVSKRLSGLSKRYPGVRFLPGISAAALGAILAGVIWLVQKADMPVREYAVLQDQETGGSLVLQDSFMQTFRTKKAFDHVDIWVANWDGAANDSVYELQILDESGTAVASGEIVGAAAPCMDAFTISFEKVTPDREQEYQILVSLKNPDCAVKTDFLYYRTGGWDMYKEGALYASGKVPDADLAFAVYEERQRDEE